MINENVHMKRWWVGLLLCGTFACTKPNPASCADGICTDQSLPFCDVDGSLGGIPDTCIAVECTPMEFTACRDDQAIVCNAVGTDFELVRCPFGCTEAAGGCNACSSNDQCPDESPICDLAQGSCRTCVLDTECDSQVCDVGTGSCVAEARVVYASPNGSNSGPCSLETPCAIARALELGAANATLVVRPLPGTYAMPVSIGTKTVSIVATGAVLTNSFAVVPGGHVTMRGGELNLVQNAFNCNGTVAQPASLDISDAKILADGTLPQETFFDSCAIRLRRVDATMTAWTFRDDSSLEADQTRFTYTNAVAAGTLTLGGGRSLKVANSILDNVRISVGVLSTGAGLVQLSFSTVAVRIGSAVDCFRSDPTNLVATLENNILVNMSGDAVGGLHCITEHNVLFPQAAPIAGTNIVGDPLLVDSVNHDFRPTAASPAVNAAVPSAALPSDHDFAGTPRPQGPKPDIGAFELMQ